nr:MAG TPA: hypothetical protein [Caudoviricetes sp.]
MSLSLSPAGASLGSDGAPPPPPLPVDQSSLGENSGPLHSIGNHRFMFFIV